MQKLAIFASAEPNVKEDNNHKRTKSQSYMVKIRTHSRSNSLTGSRPTSPSNELIIGRRYRAFDVIGSGAFASVRCGYDDINKQAVAIKMIDKEILKKSETLRLAVGREIEVMKSLQNGPRIVQLLDFVDAPTHLCLILEYVAGGELFDLIADYRDYLTETQCRRLFSELVHAVSFMHGEHVCHRDLKVENVLITCKPPARFCSRKVPPIDSGGRESEPHIKLADFGLARHFDDGELLTTRCGSEEYAAPEIILGNQYDGTKTDVWALGCILFAMIAGHLPFEIDPKRGGRRAMLWRIIRAEIKWPENGSASISGSDQTTEARNHGSETSEPKPANGSRDSNQKKQPVRRLISNSEKCIVAKMLVKADERLSAAQILQDPWIADT